MAKTTSKSVTEVDEHAAARSSFVRLVSDLIAVAIGGLVFWAALPLPYWKAALLWAGVLFALRYVQGTDRNR